MRVGILQNDQGCQCTTTLGDLWRRMCTSQKMWFVETAGSEQTSSAIMLWAKTRVYVCSGRAGGNERHLLFYARYEETWPHPTLSHVMMCARVTLRGKNDAKLCLCVLVTAVCVRGWLWKMAVCARDSSLCARVTLGGENDAKLCLCVLVTPECVRGWPPDARQSPSPLWKESLYSRLVKVARGVYQRCGETTLERWM